MYKTINGWTKQGMIDHIDANFKGKSYTERPIEKGIDTIQCAYRGKNGAKCAVGLFIPDDKYSEDFEGESIYQIGEGLFQYMPLSIEGMAKLQREHDGSDENDTLGAMIHWINTHVES